jgi:hypothetical protein
MTAGAATAPRSPYFVGPAVDFLMMGGLSLACLPLMDLGQRYLRTEQISTAVIALWWVCNWPHFSATNYRLYHSRANVAQYPITALATPVLVAIVTVAAFLSPLAVAPYFVKLMVIWSAYHFGGQTLGLTMVYARRSGIGVGNFERQALLYFVMATFLARMAGDETGVGTRFYFGIGHPRLGVPEWLAPAFILGALACGALFVGRLVIACARAKRAPPAILFVPLISYFVWFIPGRRTEYYYAFVPVFHSLQYLLIAWAMQLKEKLDIEKITPSRAYVARETARWGAINVIGGALLFFVLPRITSLSGATQKFSFAIIATAIQVHHFFVDGVIWKLQNPKVSSPLLVQLSDLVRPRAAEATPALEQKAA